MALEDVVNAGKDFSVFQGEDIARESEYSQVYDKVVSYLQRTRNPEDLPETYNRDFISASAAALRGETISNLVETVKRNYNEVITQLEEKDILQMVEKYALPKEIKGLKKAIDEGEVGALRGAYKKSIEKDKLLSYSARHLTDSDIIRIMSRRLEKQTSEFYSKELTSDKDGKPVYDSEKAQAYIEGVISKLKGKEKDNAYLELGMRYTQKNAR